MSNMGISAQLFHAAAAGQNSQGDQAASGQHTVLPTGAASERSEQAYLYPSISPGPVTLHFPEITEVSGLREVRTRLIFNPDLL
jgi:hypothetical protein